MGIFFKVLTKKSEPSNFLYYKDAASKKSDVKVYQEVLSKTDLIDYNNLTIARLRARTGISLEDAQLLLGSS